MLFSGPTTRPDADIGADHQPIQLSKNNHHSIRPPLRREAGGPGTTLREAHSLFRGTNSWRAWEATGGTCSRPKQVAIGRNPPDAPNLAHSIALSRNNYTICYFSLNPRLPASRQRLESARLLVRHCLLAKAEAPLSMSPGFSILKNLKLETSPLLASFKLRFSLGLDHLTLVIP